MAGLAQQVADGVVNFFERLDARLDFRGELPSIDGRPRTVAAALDALSPLARRGSVENRWRLLRAAAALRRTVWPALAPS